MIKKISLGTLLLAILIIAGLFFYVRSSLPKTEGEILVKGLSSEVRIVRDQSAVPHIEGKSIADVSFGLGYVHAQDRLWQMEMNRRIGAGRLSEILGEAAVGRDKFLRTVGFYKSAAETFDRLTEETQAVLKAYTNGVNAYLRTRTGALPPEFILLNFEPETWTVTDSLVWMKMMSWNLSKNIWDELERMRLLKVMSPAQLAEFLPPYPGDQPPSLPIFKEYEQFSQSSLQQLADIVGERVPEGVGSNNWVISGENTRSGKPLLANDPHLGLAAPSIWYFAHLKTPSLNTMGATLPGLPGIILGRNDHIAWGYTNTAPDVQDLFLEKVKPDNPGFYQTPDGWQEFETRKEIIKVKDANPVEVTIRSTRHGPVISDVIGGYSDALPDGMVIALAWSSLSDRDVTPDASLPMMRAKNWEEFKKAIQYFTSPQQNMVYADREGNIGYYAPGLIPVRKEQNSAMGRLPVPGWVSDYDWNGFIPFEELPQNFAPKSGRIATANQKIVGPDYDRHITFDWATPYRWRRIMELLEQENEHTVETFRDIQADIYSRLAEEFLVIMQTTKPNSPHMREALTLLSIWDGRMKSDEVAPLLYTAWLRELNKAVYGDELKGLAPAYVRQRPQFLLNVMTDYRGQSRWCDDKNTDIRETCADILQASLEAALKDLSNRYGDDMESWSWGQAHMAHSDHLPFSKVFPLNLLFDLKVQSPGDTFTVNVGRHNIRDEKYPFTNLHAASLRAIYDFSDLDESLYIHSTGQSGIFFSPYYDDMVEDWANLKYRQMSMNPADYETGSIGTLTLKPEWAGD
ncbi:penicillin acylase family protein [Sneathiella limimaris]|uniref:penicillin acylase family protein n=1 Tax=Sneathiella limimaris TaxID=1964213 RepID=UPI00146EAE82|nr:penicillin acylase family protein [Sneathiella limimaris]